MCSKRRNIRKMQRGALVSKTIEEDGSSKFFATTKFKQAFI